MGKRKQYSLRKQMVIYWVMLTLLILGIAVVYAGYIIDHYRKEFLNNNQNMTASYVKQLENEVNSLENYVKKTCVSDMHAGMAECSQMAEPAIFLCSDMASYITGVELLVDSGKEAGVLY